MFLLIFSTLTVAEIERKGYEKASPYQNGAAPLKHIWSLFRCNLNRTGMSEYDTSSNNGQLKWAYETGYGAATPIIGADGTIYFGGGSNGSDFRIYAIYPNCTKKWDFPINGPMGDSLAIDSNNTVYARDYGSGANNKLYAIYPNGTKKWEIFPGDSLESAIAVAGPGGKPIASANSAAIEGTIYFGANSSLFAYHLNGTKKWSFDLGGGHISTPAISNETIYFGVVGYNLYALYLNGTQKWVFGNNTTHFYNSPAVDSSGTIYSCAVNNTAGDPNLLYAINSNGTQKWIIPIAKSTSDYGSSPAIGLYGNIYVNCMNKLFSIRPNGTLNWSFSAVGVVSHSSPAIGSDGTIYFSSDYNLSYAIYPNGTKKWEFSIGHFGGWYSPAIGSDGTIYVGGDKLYAIGYMPVPEFTTTIVFVSLSFIAMFIAVRHAVRKRGLE